jgi:Ser/Thr protein kinase RdoA (MazF antagonist)
MAAMDGGVPMARPVATRDGRCRTTIEGALFRCHAWVDGTTKENEATTAADAAAMGRIVGRMHG